MAVERNIKGFYPKLVPLPLPTADKDCWDKLYYNLSLLLIAEKYSHPCQRPGCCTAEPFSLGVLRLAPLGPGAAFPW
jgi:hypothetical protein